MTQSMGQGVDQARARLAARQHEVLGALLAGRIPDGFDPRTARLASDQLIGKRRDEAAKACPRLAELPDWPSLFAQYALIGPREGCAPEDARAFLVWLGGDQGARDWLAEQAVRDGGRRFAWIRRRGRRELLVGAGGQLWRLALRPEQEARQEWRDG